MSTNSIDDPFTFPFSHSYSKYVKEHKVTFLGSLVRLTTSSESAKAWLSEFSWAAMGVIAYVSGERKRQRGALRKRA